ncbi:MAG TPA: STAS domain-containing protein [Sedimentisphaerales bacterium]|nr:STAS domain-containing protein [Sedimentisphaerales bacterium]
MSVQEWSENVILVDLPGEPQTREELNQGIRHVRNRGTCDVVIDFSNVTIMTSASMAVLLRLTKLLQTCGRRLSLCCVGPATRGIFSVTGLDGFFEIFDDRFDALVRVQSLPPGEAVSAKTTY